MHDLKQYRQQLNTIDEAIIDLLAARAKISRSVGEYKRTHNLPIVDSTREAEILQRLAKIAIQNSVSPLLVRQLYQAIFADSCRLQTAPQTKETT